RTTFDDRVELQPKRRYVLRGSPRGHRLGSILKFSYPNQDALRLCQRASAASAKPGGNALVTPDIGRLLPLTHEGSVFAIDQNLSGQRPGVIVGGHYRPISSGAH